jgi:hypothetical protein
MVAMVAILEWPASLKSFHERFADRFLRVLAKEQATAAMESGAQGPGECESRGERPWE